MGRRFKIVFLCIVLAITPSRGLIAEEKLPREETASASHQENAYEFSEFQQLSVQEAGKKLLEFRKDEDAPVFFLAQAFLQFFSVPRSEGEGIQLLGLLSPFSEDELSVLSGVLWPTLIGPDRFPREAENGQALTVFGDGRGNYEIRLIFLTDQEKQMYREAMKKIGPQNRSPYGQFPQALQDKLMGQPASMSHLLGKMLRKPLSKEQIKEYEKAIRDPGLLEFRFLSAKDAGKRLLEFRSKGNWEEFGRGFRMFFQIQRKEDEGKELFGILGLPLGKKELEAIDQEVLCRKTAKGTYVKMVFNGCDISLYGNAAGGSDIRVIFFTTGEVKELAEAYRKSRMDKSFPAKYFSSDLEAKCMGDPVPMSYLLGSTP